MQDHILIAILSSSLISGVIGACIAGWFTLRSKRNDYINDYYKSVLARRLAAYEEVEHLITMLKSAVLDGDQRPYHLLFSKDDDHETVYKLMFLVLSKSLWLTDDLFEKTRELNVLLYRDGGSDSGLIEFGKTNYKTIAELRTQIEKIHARDMIVLHNVPGFLKSKRHVDSYSPIERRG
jgi:hypothetical protein